MDTCIVSRSEELLTTISTALSKRHVECPPENIIELDSDPFGHQLLDGFDGVVLLGVESDEPHESDLIQQISSLLSPRAKLVVVAYNADSGTVIRAIRAGASDFLLADEAFHSEVGNLLTRFELEHKSITNRGRVVTVLPCHSPQDANLLSANIAAVAASHLSSCGLLDFHFRGGDLAFLLKLNPQHTVFDLLSQTEAVDRAMLQQAMSVHNRGIHLLASPATSTDMSTLRFSACQEIIALARQLWPAVVISAEDLVHAEQIQTLSASDQIVLTMRLDVASLYRTQETLKSLQRQQFLPEQIRVVAMGTGQSGELPLSAVRDLLRVSEVFSIPDDAMSSLVSLNLGNPVVFELPKSAMAKAMWSLTSLLFNLESEEEVNVKRTPVGAIRAATMLAVNSLAMCR